MTAAPTPRAGGPLGALFGLLNSVSFGIWLLVILFVYCTIGSAGAFYPTSFAFWDPGVWEYHQIRTFRGLEMTEYEWFNWWPFDLLMLLICLNITVVTLKRIKLNAINAGVWMIHSGVIVLCLGSVWYFGTKVEGDTPVLRRQVSITLPSGETGVLPVIPGAVLDVGEGLGRWNFQISSANPDYTMLSGPDKGQQRYSVMVSVQPPASDPFMRQLIAGHPENTEDVIRSDDPQQPMARAVKVLGKPLVNEELGLDLDFLPQTHFYLANWVEKSWALYLRERKPDGTYTEWAQRPLDGMPLFNDYVKSPEEIWTAPGREAPIDPLDVVAESSDPNDPLAGVPIEVTSYLRYAMDQSRRVAGGDRLFPELSLRFDDGMGQIFDTELTAFPDPSKPNELDFLDFKWAATVAERQALVEPSPPVLRFQVPGVEGLHEATVSGSSLADEDLAFEQVPGSDYAYRVQFIQDLKDQGVLCSLELKNGDRHFRRWVFDAAHRARNMDVSLESQDDGHNHAPGEHVDHEHRPSLLPKEVLEKDDGIEVWFEPGNDPRPVFFVAGPGDDDLGLVMNNMGAVQDGEYVPIRIGERISLGGNNTVSVTSYLARSQVETRPYLVPLEERNKDARERRSMAHLAFTVGGETLTPWVRFHEYVFDRPDDPRMPFGTAMRRFPFDPERLELPDGRRLELMLGRERMELVAPVVLDDFVLTSHVGGFSGRTPSIRNWTSHVRFADEDGDAAWGGIKEVTVNGPAEHDGFWFFQSAWDPPSRARFRGEVDSAGLNYTVLGVGNRNGVGVQLLGCAIAVVGMIYAFYVKPLLIARRRKRGGGRAALEAGAARVRAGVRMGGLPEDVA